MNGPCFSLRQIWDRDQDRQNTKDAELEAAREAESFSFGPRHKLTNTRLESEMITANDLSRLRHMLGVDAQRYTQKQWGFRNYFAAGAGEQTESMLRLQEAGFVRQGEVFNESHYYHATEEGCKAVGMNSEQIKRALED